MKEGRRVFLLNPCKLSLWRLFGWHNAKSACPSLLSHVLQLCWHHSVIIEMEQTIRLTLTQMASFDSGEDPIGCFADSYSS